MSWYDKVRTASSRNWRTLYKYGDSCYMRCGKWGIFIYELTDYSSGGSTRFLVELDYDGNEMFEKRYGSPITAFSAMGFLKRLGSSALEAIGCTIAEPSKESGGLVVAKFRQLEL